jgi:heterodisulfide reductase subunit A
MEPALDRVLHHARVEVLTGAEPVRVRGAFGRFEVELSLRPRGVDPGVCLGCGACARACPAERPDPWAPGLGTAKAIGLPYPGCLPHVSVLDRDACLRARGSACDACRVACALGAISFDAAPSTRTVTVGAIVLATGLAPGEVLGPDGLVSSYQLERMLHPDGPTGGALRGVGGRAPDAVLLAPGVDGDGELAARELLKLAGAVKHRAPRARVAVAGDLARVPGLGRLASALAAQGVELLPARLVPGGVDPAGGRLRAQLSGGSEAAFEADLVVVHAASRPAPGTDALARLLRVATGDRGFLVDGGASPFEPTATRIAGVHVAGAAAGPRSIRDAIRDGAAAAGLVHAALVPGERIALEPLAAEIDRALCGGCAVCVSVCPFGAVELADKAQVVAVHCRGCGSCAAACPTGAASARHFTRAQIAAEISALLAGDPAPAAEREP